MERENRYVAVYEENKALRRENRMLLADLRKHERNLQALQEMVNRLQDAIVNQALLIGMAMKYEGDSVTLPEEDE